MRTALFELAQAFGVLLVLLGLLALFVSVGLGVVVVLIGCAVASLSDPLDWVKRYDDD